MNLIIFYIKRYIVENFVYIHKKNIKYLVPIEWRINLVSEMRCAILRPSRELKNHAIQMNNAKTPFLDNPNVHEST